MTVTYYLTHYTVDGVRRPVGLAARLDFGGHRLEDYSFTERGTWERTEQVQRMLLGIDDPDTAEATREEARRFLDVLPVDADDALHALDALAARP